MRVAPVDAERVNAEQRGRMPGFVPPRQRSATSWPRRWRATRQERSPRGCATGRRAAAIDAERVNAERNWKDAEARTAAAGGCATAAAALKAATGSRHQGGGKCGRRPSTPGWWSQQTWMDAEALAAAAGAA
jgi:hypothetical protein